jgi:hypothetical protein
MEIDMAKIYEVRYDPARKMRSDFFATLREAKARSCWNWTVESDILEHKLGSLNKNLFCLCLEAPGAVLDDGKIVFSKRDRRVDRK